MTSYMTNNLWRHMNLKLHQLGYLYVTWPKSRDVISVRYHVMKVITPEKPGTELASFLEKNPKFIFWSLMTSYIADYLWRHMNLKLHQLGYLYVTWPKSRDVISVRYHVMKFISPKHPRNELASYLERKSRRVWEGLGVLFLERISNTQNFDYFDDFFSKRVFWEMSQRHFWKIPATFSVLELCVFSKVCFFHWKKNNYYQHMVNFYSR